MKQIEYTWEDGSGEELVVEDTGTATLDIGVTIGPDFFGRANEEGDHFYVTMNEQDVAELVQVLDQWLLERQCVREHAEDHLDTRD